MLKLTTQLAAVTLTSDPLTLKLVHRVLVSHEPFLPSLVFVGLFVFPLGGGMGQTDGRTGSTHDGASFYEGRPHNNHVVFLNVITQCFYFLMHACVGRLLCIQFQWGKISLDVV